MAKLFDEVLGSERAVSSSADVFIYFNGERERVESGPGGEQQGAAVERDRVESTGSPSPTHKGQRTETQISQPLRCHSLLVKTQPSLYEAFLQHPWSPSPRQPSPVAVSPAPNGNGSGLDAASPEKTEPPRRGSPTQCSDLPSVLEVMVDDEPEVLLELLRFIYLSQINIDSSNVKAILRIADKYNVEEVVTLCLKWMGDNFTASLFYSMRNFELSNDHFRTMLKHSLLLSMGSRRNFSLVTEDPQWQQLPCDFVVEVLSRDDLPIVSEQELLVLISRSVIGKDGKNPLDGNVNESTGTATPGRSVIGKAAKNQLDSSSEGTVTTTATPVNGQREGRTSGSLSRVPSERASEDIKDHSIEEGRASDEGDEDQLVDPDMQLGEGGPQANQSNEEEERKDKVLQLLRTFRKCDVTINVADFEALLEILQVNHLFSTKPPRNSPALDPGFLVYRGEPTAQPFTTGLTSGPDVTPYMQEGLKMILGGRDFMRQQEGFLPSMNVLPHLLVKIECQSWSHREKRSAKHSSSGLGYAPMGGAVSPDGGGTPRPSTSEDQINSTLKTMQVQPMSIQDDLDIGRSLRAGSTTNIRAPGKEVLTGVAKPDLDRIDHAITCGVISGHMRHGIKVSQEGRTSIYQLENLYGQCEGVRIGGSPTEVEFQLRLVASSPNHCGICQCVLSVIHAEAMNNDDALLQIRFDVSVKEELHFYVSSMHFDSNSSYSTRLKWVWNFS